MFSLRYRERSVVLLKEEEKQEREKKMVRVSYATLTTPEEEETAALLHSDLNELKIAAKKLINHAATLGGVVIGTSFLKWLASFAAMSVFLSPPFLLN